MSYMVENVVLFSGKLNFECFPHESYCFLWNAMKKLIICIHILVITEDVIVVVALYFRDYELFIFIICWISDSSEDKI